MGEMNRQARALLDAARAARPSTEARARIASGLATRLGAAGHGGGSPPKPPGAPSAGGAPVSLTAGPAVVSTAAAKTLAVVALVTAGAAGLWRGRPAPPPAPLPAVSMATPIHETASARSSSSVPAPPASEPVPPLAAPPPNPRVHTPLSPHRPSPAPPPFAAPPPSAAPPAASAPDELGEEVTALRSAQQAMKQGDAERALATLDDLGARRPDGLLREERLAARVLALCAAGRIEDARAAGRRFVAEMPASVQAERVRASCAFAKDDRVR